MKVKSIDEIKDILETAAYVDRLLPAVQAPKYRCCMPNIIYTQQEIAFMDRRLVKPRPTQEQVSLWEKVILDWLPLLTVDEKKLVWKRANRIPWKLLCREFGVSRQQLWLKYDKALTKIQFGIKPKKCH